MTRRRFALFVVLLAALGAVLGPPSASAEESHYGPQSASARAQGDTGEKTSDHMGAYNLLDASGRVSLEIVNPDPTQPPPVAQVTLPVAVVPTADWFYYEVVVELHDASDSESIECTAAFHDSVSRRVVLRSATSGESHVGASTLTLSIFDYQFRTQRVAEDELNVTVQCTMHVGDKLYSYRVARL